MINLILCTEKIDLVADFYGAVGVELVTEKHGSGPEHFSFNTDVDMEIYPHREPQTANFVLRINIPDLQSTMQRLATDFSYDGFLIRDFHELNSGFKSIIRDPDGRVVELFQPK